MPKSKKNSSLLSGVDLSPDTIFLPKREEFVVDSPSSPPRQAGSDIVEGKFVREFRTLAETNLYAFSKVVIGRDYLTKHLHRPVCNWLQARPPFRKLLLMPRAHAKTSLVGHCLPAHIIIQPPATNIYFPGMAGTESRILLAGENVDRSSGNLSVIQSNFDNNDLLRALWPQAIWDNPKSRGKASWNSTMMVVPRETSWPDPTIRAIGVGGAIAGARPNVLIKDDLISLEAAKSEAVMRTAIEWHIASRALMDQYDTESGLQSLEWIIGTRWAVYDLYSHVMDTDPTVETLVHAIVEDGLPIWPERYTLQIIEDLKKQYGIMFWLLFMNSAANPELTDFDLSQLRTFSIVGDQVFFDEDARDAELNRRQQEPVSTTPKPPAGTKLTRGDWQELVKDASEGGFRLRFK